MTSGVPLSIIGLRNGYVGQSGQLLHCLVKLVLGGATVGCGWNLRELPVQLRNLLCKRVDLRYRIRHLPVRRCLRTGEPIGRGVERSREVLAGGENALLGCRVARIPAQFDQAAGKRSQRARNVSAGRCEISLNLLEI
jgi:hypothetical protein